ncbi:MAG: hypothetical protein ACFFB5_05600 [Promethearchaeota archaeon]
MVNVTEKLSDFQLLVFEVDSEENLVISRHKVLILTFYILSFILTFLHFASLSPEAIEGVHSAFLRGEEPAITPSSFLSLAAVLYLYISAMALFSLFKNGKLPNFLQKPKLPSFRTRYKILLILSTIFFTGLTVAIVYISIISTFFVIVALGPLMFYIWMFLEPFFLLNGILIFIDIIDTDYPLESYSRYSLFALIILSVIGLFGPLIAAILLGFNRTSGEFIELSIFNSFDFSLFKPAIASYRSTLSGIVVISFMFMLLWFIKDHIKGTEPTRERKKGILPFYLGFSLLIISTSMIPIIASSSGSLAELTSILDLLGLFLAIILGVWRVLGIEQRMEPLNGIERVNPIERINCLHPYSKTLVLFVMSIWGFYYSLENAAIAVITGYPDQLKIQQLELLAGLIGLVYIIILWRFKGKPRSEAPGILKQAPELIKTKVQELKESF